MAANTNGGTQSDRIAALEEGYRNIGREVGGLREDFATFARDMRHEHNARSRTQWSPLIAGIGVVVAIMGGLITLGAQGPLREIDRHAIELRTLDHSQDDDARRVWEAIAALRDEDFDRPEAEKMLADLIGRIDLRDDAIRREIAAELRGIRAREPGK